MKNPIAYHLTLRARYPFKPFREREQCSDIWSKMIRLFPEAASAVLMPNHLHVVVWHCDSDPMHRLKRLRHTLSRQHGSEVWETGSELRAIPDQFHLKRQIRYVHLNPCRSALCGDPIAWEWSTHRDYLGAVATPWPDLKRASRIWKFERRAFHQYVSGDPSVHPLGTPLFDEFEDAAILGLDSAARAFVSVMRADQRAATSKGVLRATLLRVFVHQFGISTTQACATLQMSRTGVSSAQKGDIEVARAIRVVLTDPRMLGSQGTSQNGGSGRDPMSK